MNFLPSWTDGSIKNRILDFVARVTSHASVEFVPAAERIAVFDDDGTLWCEYPIQAQLLFAFERIDQLAKDDPELAQKQPHKAFLERDMELIAEFGQRRMFQFALAAFAGMSTDEFNRRVKQWIATAENVQLARRCRDCVYQPQIELLEFLHARGFKVFIVSSGGVEFIRAFVEELYGIPPERVIGSSEKARYEIHGGEATLVHAAEINSFDDGEAKAENINLHIGRRPIFAFGNSDGDLAMLRYTTTGPGKRLALLLHHDDPEREFAYDRNFELSPLDRALARAEHCGVDVVSMKRDWKTVFGATRVKADPEAA